MKKVVHQIWLGGELPEREAAWVSSVRGAAVAAGWEHCLWSWGGLRERYAGEESTAIFARLLEELPMPPLYSFVSDYYRLRLLADGGGVYMDTDFSVEGAWPELPVGAAVFMTTERYSSKLANSCFTYCREPEAARLAVGLMDDALRRRLPGRGVCDLAARFVEWARDDGGRPGLAAGGLGPGFVRRRVLPAWGAGGFCFRLIGADVVGNSTWSERAPIEHHSAGSWMTRGAARRAAYWQDAAQKAAALAALHKREALAGLPVRLLPHGAAIVPARFRRKRSAVAAPRVVDIGAARLRLPGDVRRVVVVSNITQGFSVESAKLGAGDLVIHCNYARHRAAAMAVKGTRHWLFVRHGGAPRGGTGFRWFHSGAVDGFERVFFINQSSLGLSARWLAEFRRRTHKSPTTGFIVANTMREFAPHLPLVLAGFDPAADHGTYRWDGHDWAAEAAWYKERGFFLLQPLTLN